MRRGARRTWSPTALDDRVLKSLKVDQQSTSRQVIDGLVRWAERNVQIALKEPTEHHDELASQLVSALIDGPATVRTRRGVLATAISQL